MRLRIHLRARCWLREHRQEILVTAGIAVVAGALLLLTQAWWDESIAHLKAAPPWIFGVFISVLPLVGFSITLVNVVVGARFGGLAGLTWIAAATAVHLIGSHVIARTVLRRPVEAWIKRRKYRLPRYAKDEPVALTLLGALVPGLPYAVRNYLLAASGVPFRIFFLVCWPVYVARSAVAILLGTWAEELTTGRAVVLAAIFVFKLTVCAVVVRYLYRRHHPADSAQAVAAAH
jgi:uncharacterized membrane protein YdjX (TVP38/TMEM64 family)